jgi:phosphoglycerate dehydrogenase-like enzyme
MTFLLPTHDGIADYVAERLPKTVILRHGEVPLPDVRHVQFYCLPYIGTQSDLDLIGQMPRLRVLQTLSSGVDDVLHWTPDGVTLCNGRGLHHEESAAELAVALVLAALRGLPQFIDQQSRGIWAHRRTQTVDGKRVLLVGYGMIGQAIEHRLAPFGVRISRASRTARPGVAPLSRLIRLASETDVLICCIALSEATRGLVDAEVLAALPNGALVVNVARGAVLDSEALLAELQDGRLSAALDVTTPEPLPTERPEWQLKNLLITPHIGGDTFEFVQRAVEFVASQAERFVRAEPLHNVIER